MDLQGIGAAMALQLDLTDEASIEAAVGAVLERHRRIDVLDVVRGRGIGSSSETSVIAPEGLQECLGLHGIKHGEHVRERHVALNVVAGREDVATIGTQLE